MEIQAWTVEKPKTGMSLLRREEHAGPDEVLLEVAGCGVCHTDLGYFYEGVLPRHPFPLTLGHEISGTVIEAGPGSEAWLGRDAVVSAVIPCGVCDACRAGQGRICPKQIFPGCDLHGGFASHVRVPAVGLCPVPDLKDPRANPHGLDLAMLSVVADAVSTPYQAIQLSGLAAGDLAVFVGAGGVGGFGVQLAAAAGAQVIAIDTDQQRLDLIAKHGAGLTLVTGAADDKGLRQAVRAFAKQHEIPTWRHRIFETSGTPAGQQTAFGLLGPGAYLGVVGFTQARAELRLSNLMAFDATARGNWGCLPELYPAVLERVLSGQVALAPFVERRPLASINQTFEDLRAHRVSGRVILVPEG